MKSSRIFAMALIASFVFLSSTPARAVSLGTYDIQAYDRNLLLGYSTHDYLVSGTLENNAQVSITYTAEKVSFGGLLDGSAIGHKPSLTALRNSILPLLSITGIHGGILTDTILITNTSGCAENFAAYFLSIIKLIKGGAVGVTVAFSSVPLPPAFLLFASGLMALAGFAAHKKAR